MPIHPEGEDQSSEAIAMIRCPHCKEQVAVPKLAPVEKFDCPQCGKPIPIDFIKAQPPITAV